MFARYGAKIETRRMLALEHALLRWPADNPGNRIYITLESSSSQVRGRNVTLDPTSARCQ